MTLKCDHLITAFGCENTEKWAQKLVNKNGHIDIDYYTN
jgi:hypothetical protein